MNRREFLINAAALTGSAFLDSIPEAIRRALEIDPEAGTTFLDAEHIVILMQENRSFDHTFGTLSGVRGLRDPRAHILPNGRKVWFQTDAAGKTFAPFRLDMKGSNVTWVGGLPHSWTDQVDARNNGLYDKWLIAKARKDLPYAMGYYTRQDLPFYYALADAFTVCDQAFCSSLTGTTPNRLYLWSGTIREDALHTARVTNGDTDYDAEAAWTTYPERLEDAGVSWRVYQNEISLGTGLTGDQDSWLSNFTDNPLEWMSQYRVRFSKTRRDFIAKQIEDLPKQIEAKQTAARSEQGDAKEKLEKDAQKLQTQFEAAKKEQSEYNEETWNALSPRDRAIHEKAFTTNVGDPNYRALEKLTYTENGEERTVNVPKGDVLYQFRKDTETGKLPAVSWIVAPETFSDHPGSAWFGAWYLSEVMNILTKDPEVWKKTIFILCYDENDGYFDHYPPFVAPHPGRPETGKVSAGIDTAEDVSDAHRRDSSIGLGFRCPLVVASPWSRGGCVNSQVFDHTSVIQLIESWLDGKGKPVREPNISAWRRTVCGDMTSVFKPYNGEAYPLPKPLNRNETIIGIHKARFLAPMAGITAIPESEIPAVDVGVAQERGTRPSCPLPYRPEVNALIKDGVVEVTMQSRGKTGMPFNGYSYLPEMTARSYAVKAGDKVTDQFPFSEKYEVRIDGPNGYMRHFKGSAGADLEVSARERGPDLEVTVANIGSNPVKVTISDNSYEGDPQSGSVPPKGSKSFMLSAKASRGWYDWTVSAPSLNYRLAGRVETGEWSITDPAMS